MNSANNTTQGSTDLVNKDGVAVADSINMAEDESNLSSSSNSSSSCDQQRSLNRKSLSNSNTMTVTASMGSKKRGRPRLYEMNPTTGKSIKGRLTMFLQMHH